jgi:hypothetical protein
MDRVMSIWADVARIRLEDASGQQLAFGSGRLIGTDLVLTARHVVETEEGVALPDEGWEVRLLGERDGDTWRGEPIPAKVIWRATADLALLHLTDAGHARAASSAFILRLARYDQVVPDLKGVWFAGFPDAAREQTDIAREYGAPASLRRADDSSRYWVTVAAANTPKENLNWGGCSGGVVLLRKQETLFLLGVLARVPRAFSGSLHAVPITEGLNNDEPFRERFKALLREAHSFEPGDIQQVERLPGAYEVLGIEEYEASESVFARALGCRSYGRDIIEFNARVAGGDRGATIIRAEAGMGKSVALAHWAAYRASQPEDLPATTVLRHAFSVAARISSTREAMFKSLVRQAAIALGPDALGEGEAHYPGHLPFLLSRDQPPGTELIVALDALDEAAEVEVIEPLMIGRGVHVVATYRAEPNETPAIIEKWCKKYTVAGIRFAEVPLGRLDHVALAQWLTDATGTSYSATDPVVERVMQASEGVPLFAHYLIPDAIDALRRGEQDPFPKSFSEYASEQMEHLREAFSKSPGQWNAILALFAILTQAKTSVPGRWVQKFIGNKHADFSLDNLDERIERWLWWQGSSVSFVHPRLASIFRPLLRENVSVDLDDIGASLIEACTSAWNKPEDVLRVYALDWLPRHFIDTGRDLEAAELLGNGAFHRQRLIASGTSTMVHKTSAETIALAQRLGPYLADTHPAFDWYRFWAETESQVVFAVERAENLSTTAADVLVQLAHDRFGAEAHAFHSLVAALKHSPSGRLVRACGFRHPTLRRSLDHAHDNVVQGVLALADGLVSWGAWDGAIRFWTLAGEPRPGGDLNAHPGGLGGGVGGVFAFADGLVSWGRRDGAIRFWTLAGEPRPGGDLKAHRDGVGGVLALADGLVSWGQDGAIRLWTFAGEPRPGGDPAAHRKGVGGVLALADRLVSWGQDGAIRLWTLAGEPRPGGDPAAHRKPVEGVLALADRLVSWGQDGAIRFWTLAGEPRPGGDSAAHPYAFGVGGVLALADGLVSWGGFGAIRFWTLAGDPRPGGDFAAHPYGVRGVLALADRLVSWGERGAIRFWTLAGEPRPGGDPAAHLNGIEGVLVLADGLVSWGEDGAIRFWTLAGEAGPGDGLGAHRGGVWGVLALADGLVSWGKDGAIRFWTLSGDPRPGGDLEAEIRGVLALADRLVSWGEDGAIRFWTLAGEPRPGGHPAAHHDAVWGVLALADGLVSWGRDGAIRFWTLAGDPRPGGHPAAHERGVAGVLALADGLVSWGRDGAIRFWTLSGVPRPGGDPEAEVLGALALADGLVSWGRDGAIRFWTLAGEPKPGGGLGAHQGVVSGILALADGLVSWGRDGAIRFWTLAGEPRPGIARQAHPGGVWRVLALADGLVSWGQDGAIRFWTLAGEPRPGGEYAVRHGEVGGILALADGAVSWGDGDIIRRWTPDGVPHGPPWIAPAPLDMVTKVADDLWVGLLGRPHRLLLN